MIHGPIRTRFESFLEKGECWLWVRGKYGSGYGSFCLNGKPQGAHRAAYQIYVGPIPEGMDVCHTCDIPHCVNPAHLFVGTRADNVRDMLAKGRGRKARGERSGNAKYTSEQIAEIRRRHEAGETIVSLAREFHAGRNYFGRVIRRQRRKYDGDPAIVGASSAAGGRNG